MIIHALFCIALGSAAAIIPHSLYMKSFDDKGQYNHMSHEFVRLYGCLTLAIGWFVWSTRGITDGRLVRATCETFCLCYLLQAVVLVRAQLTNPSGHSIVHWIICTGFLLVGLLYGLFRMFGKIKDFELPGVGKD